MSESRYIEYHDLRESHNDVPFSVVVPLICPPVEPELLAEPSAFMLPFLDDADLDPLADSSAVVVGAGVFFVGDGTRELPEPLDGDDGEVAFVFDGVGVTVVVGAGVSMSLEPDDD